MNIEFYMIYSLPTIAISVLIGIYWNIIPSLVFLIIASALIGWIEIYKTKNSKSKKVNEK